MAVILTTTLFPPGDTFHHNLVISPSEGTVGVVIQGVAVTAIAEVEVHSQRRHNNKISHNSGRLFHSAVPAVTHVVRRLQTL